MSYPNDESSAAGLMDKIILCGVGGWGDENLVVVPHSAIAFSTSLPSGGGGSSLASSVFLF
eukprot:gene1788-1083_t